MPEKDFTKKLTRLLKSTDRLVQEVEGIVAAVKEIKVDIQQKLIEMQGNPGVYDDDDGLGKS